MRLPSQFERFFPLSQLRGEVEAFLASRFSRSESLELRPGRLEGRVGLGQQWPDERRLADEVWKHSPDGIQ